MHERQVLVVSTILIISIIFVSESFAQEQHQCNGLDATHVGTEDNDKIRGTSGDDVIVTLGGNDVIYSKGGNDVICSGEGNDKIYGNSGNDILIGGPGEDKLYGGQGIDTCDATSEDKRIIGCENEFKITQLVNDGNLQSQLNDLQNQINNIIFGLINWADIQGIPESLADGDDDMLSKMECDAEQILVFDGIAWVCNDVNLVSNAINTCQGDLVNFAGLSHGDTIEDIQNYLNSYGILVSATGYGTNPINSVIIYNSNIDDGEDSDLEVGIGNIVIIPDKVENPSDSAKGGIQIYDISPEKDVDSIVIVDIESDEAGLITAYNSDGDIITSVNLPETGNKSYKTVNLGAKNVAKLVLDYNSSGGITDICISDTEDETKIECSVNQFLTYDGEKWVCTDVPEISVVDTLSELNCDAGQIIKKNGIGWECSVDEKGNQDQTEDKASSAVFFHHGLIGSSQTEWVGTSIQVFDPAEMDKALMIMPTSGTISNLFAKTGSSLSQSPGTGESYKLTILVNGQESTPSLSCTIANEQTACSNKLDQIHINEGDSIVLQIEASANAPFAIISSSALLTS